MSGLFLFYFRKVKKVVIIGGGLAGLTNAILLRKAGFEVIMFEEKAYPFHRVCGEYISNEVVPFLKRNDLYPDELSPVELTQFHLSSPSGKMLRMPLDLGGFGISRYRLDQWLYQKCLEVGVEVHHERVVLCNWQEDHFLISSRDDQSIHADLVIGAFGKRSTLDKNLDRSFISKRYPYIGVKYHLETDLVDSDAIELHNFKDGYCGISRIEDGKFNLCYLSHRKNLKQYGSIGEMEKEILHLNPFLKNIFQESTFLFDKPEVINEISFEPKEPVYRHILMTGDSAGMITPLCGNGMAMAIHSASLLSGLIIDNQREGFNRPKLEEDYAQLWKHHFAGRLWAGRKIQALFGAPVLSEMAVALGRSFRPFASYLMKQTHGRPF